VQEIIAAAEAVIAAVDQTALAKHLARKTPEEGPGAAERKKRADEQKGALVEALEKKASALLELNPTEPGDAPAESPDARDVQVRFHALLLGQVPCSYSGTWIPGGHWTAGCADFHRSC
jgi:hypothetical protein